MNRLDIRLAELKQQQRSGLVCYFTAGAPDEQSNVALLSQIGQAGADIIELGMPFSDPVADGEVIEAAHHQAIAQGHTLAKTLQLVREIRKQDEQTPIVLMGYVNPILQYGFQQFLQDATGLIDGLLIVDLPYEYQREYLHDIEQNKIHFICLTSPSTPEQRLALIAKNAQGFLYHVAENGVTGMQRKQQNLDEKIIQLKQYFDIPIGIGFGIKTEQDIAALNHKADLVIVGTTLVDCLVKSGVAATLQKVQDFAKVLRA
ncbi:tryptophan synthase subunit alpha [Acinetobacter sp. CFCC 10889]|uniref:tryptophan synthase subunit alpha n=1 Tax=Acinetobacter sp. CFCC 10889 TaxID=1775557 RepID=UPI000DCFA447|nr:tryptophan synthase subunit alpha [Acinetobacter sp. CFCC 10889]